MKLVSYNIQYTKGRDGRFDTVGIVDLLQGADVIALQEVEQNRPHSGMTDQVADLDAQARSTHINTPAPPARITSPSGSRSTSREPPVKTISIATVKVVGALCGAYFISQFYRASIADIAPDLARDLALSPQALGTVTGAFFLAFGATQIPLGIMLDRFGPRYIMAGLLLATVAGSLVFAAADSLAILTLGRALI